ncbi:cytochrome-c oxidase [Ornithinibacillus californiensis]|uniref:cytochrome-c oxidase n=1 Tax=Ornithinibacillus californiensis TaxID=161536 RepID=UPI00064D9A1F|nr:cytochrome-c oxidase [Ornithinibacillus californiensis]
MGNVLIKISVIYFMIGVLLGLYMSIAHNYALTGVHVHINLLGWMSLVVAGIIYKLYPNLEQTAAAKIHFWLHNLGLPVMMGGLTLLILGNPGVVVAVSIGSIVVVIGIASFVFNVLVNLK